MERKEMLDYRLRRAVIKFSIHGPSETVHPSVVASSLHIDRHEDRLGNRSVILAQRENTAPCRRYDTAKLFVGRNIVCAGSSTENVNFIVVPSYQAARPEVANLSAGMTSHIVREYHFQPTPDLALLLPWI